MFTGATTQATLSIYVSLRKKRGRRTLSYLSGEDTKWIAAVANKKTDPGDGVYLVIDWARDASQASQR
ncbi:MAG: hypothetical protein ACOX7W_02635 [Christensenellales bacterium]